MNRRILIIAIVLATLAASGIWFFYLRRPPSKTGADTISFSPEVQQIERELEDLRRLKELQIDTDILQNPFVQSLTRLPSPTTATSTLQQITPGRSNPFVPL